MGNQKDYPVHSTVYPTNETPKDTFAGNRSHCKTCNMPLLSDFGPKTSLIIHEPVHCQRE